MNLMSKILFYLFSFDIIDLTNIERISIMYQYFLLREMEKSNLLLSSVFIS